MIAFDQKVDADQYLEEALMEQEETEADVCRAVMQQFAAHSPDFPSNDYGLLNYGKIFLQCASLNSSDPIQEFSPEFPSQYSTVEIVVLAIVMTVMMIVVVVGNMLVIIAVATEHSLSNVQNWLIASLAFADLSLGLIIMPFSLAKQLLGYWMFGSPWCDIHSALDVLLSTSSIMNLCLISLDRYWSITRALDYLNNRTQARVMLYIIAVWVLSAGISIPPLLGWKQDPDREWFFKIKQSQKELNISQVEFVKHLHSSLGDEQFKNFTQTLESSVFPQCELSGDVGYVMYSAFGSFYIPSCIMVFVYIKIYFAARARARRHIKPKGSPTKKVENYTMANPKQATNGSSQQGTKGTPEPKPATGAKNGVKTNEEEHHLPNGGCKNLAINSSQVNGTKPLADVNHEETRLLAVSKKQEDEEDATPNGLLPPKDTEVGGSAQEDAECNGSEFGEPSSDSGHPYGCIRLKTRILPKLRFGRRLSKETREMIDIGKTPVKSVSRNMAEGARRCDVGPPNNQSQDKEKKRLARKKERRATLILGLIMGSFIACWFPFFFMYSISPVCPVCEAIAPNKESTCCIKGWGFSFAFWLGYSNSALNPVIYTVFNNDFRRAFKKILFK